MDEKLKKSQITTNFVAAVYKDRDKPIPENQQAKELNRFEFMELLVRLADSKYREKPKSARSFDNAAELLIQDLIENFTPASWHQFRKEELWQRECNLVLEANLEPLRAVYSLYSR